MRHGDCIGLKQELINGWRDFGLTSKGKEEAKKVASNIQKLLGSVKIDKAYSSYLSRTYDTARLFCDTLKFKGKVKQDLRLNERHYGMFQGMNKNDARAFKEYNTLSDSDKRLENKLVPENDIRHKETLNEYSEKLKKPIKKIEDTMDIDPNTKIIVDNIRKMILS